MLYAGVGVGLDLIVSNRAERTKERVTGSDQGSTHVRDCWHNERQTSVQM